jgi:hypothetical protein
LRSNRGKVRRLADGTAGGAEALRPTNPSDDRAGFARAFFFLASAIGLRHPRSTLAMNTE